MCLPRGIPALGEHEGADGQDAAATRYYSFHPWVVRAFERRYPRAEARRVASRSSRFVKPTFCPCTLGENAAEHDLLLDLFLARTEPAVSHPSSSGAQTSRTRAGRDLRVPSVSACAAPMGRVTSLPPLAWESAR
jgi:hypothetical protein